MQADNNKGELYQEVRKCFGTIGSLTHGSNRNNTTYKSMTSARADNLNNFLADNIPTTGTAMQLCMAYDTESFSKSATESGLNLVDDSLNCQFEVKCSADGLADATHYGALVGGVDQLQVRYDTFAMSDCVFYIDAMGRIVTQI